VSGLRRVSGPEPPVRQHPPSAIVEIVPAGEFVTYGIGVPLLKMRDTVAAQARVPVRSIRTAGGPLIGTGRSAKRVPRGSDGYGPRPMMLGGIRDHIRSEGRPASVPAGGA
jgi:hypothetical protein